MFTTQVIISFVVGGLFIAFQTIFAERVPLRWRGPILTIPSTLALGFFFIGLTKSPNDILEVAQFFPAALAPDYVFVLLFATLSRYNLGLSFLFSFLGWGLFAYLILLYPPESFFISTFVYALPIVLVAYFLIKKFSQVTTIVPVPFTSKHIFIRSMIGGSVIVLAVILSKFLGNIWGSLFSAFPAVFASTFFIYYSVHGREIIPSVAKSLFFPGFFVFILYSWVAGLTFPIWGIWWGTLFSYIAVAIFYGLLSVARFLVRSTRE